MAAQLQGTSAQTRWHRHATGTRLRSTDSFGLVLLLIVVDYIAVSALTNSAWGRLVIVVLLGTTLVFALRTARARRLWQLLAAVYLLASTLITLAAIVAPGAFDLSQQTSILGGLLLLITPIAIARRIVTHQVVTTQTVLGAVCVYLLIGFSFAFIFTAIAFVIPTPFFTSQAHATANEFLFFSYTTLTTVGYGNLVPAGSVGQTFAMLEALFGQIFLVIVVARLVSLWGLERPRATARATEATETTETSSPEHDDAQHDPPRLAAR